MSGRDMAGNETGRNEVCTDLPCPPVRKNSRRRTPGRLQPVVSNRPWQILACGVTEPFPRSPRGNFYLSVVTDHFTKWVALFPLRTLTSQRLRERLLDTFPRLGFPSQLMTDNAAYFTSKLFKDPCAVLGIQHKKTSPYHP